MSDTQARKAALKLGSLQDQEIADLLAKIFHPDSQQRPTAREALAELKKMAGPTPQDNLVAGELLVTLKKSSP
jgi:hypothetical protein